MVTCAIMTCADTLRRPENRSCSLTKSEGCMLAMSSALSVLKLSVLTMLSASLLSQTLIVRTSAVAADIRVAPTVGR